MSKYTVRRHVQRLECMLLQEAPCSCCPAYRRFDVSTKPIKDASMYDHQYAVELIAKPVCIICRGFVDLPEHGHGCPCKVLGEKKALAKTFAALKEYHREQGD